MASQLGRRRGTPINNKTASAVPAVEGQNRSSGLLYAVAAVVVMVNVEVCCVVPLSVTDVEDSPHEAGLLDAVGLIVHASDTAPENPFDGVTEIVEVLLLVAPRVTVMAPELLSAKLATPPEFAATACNASVCICWPVGSVPVRSRL